MKSGNLSTVQKLAATLASAVLLCVGLAGCSQIPIDRTQDSGIVSSLAKVKTVGGPQGWTVRKSSLSIVEPSRPGTPYNLTRGDLYVQFKLDTASFAGVTGWDSPAVPVSDKTQVTAICTMFVSWLVNASSANQVNTAAANLGDYYLEDCTQTLMDPNAEKGPMVWFIEPSIGHSVPSWYVGGVVTYTDTTAMITAVLGFNGAAYSDAEGGNPLLPSTAPGGKKTATAKAHS